MKFRILIAVVFFLQLVACKEVVKDNTFDNATTTTGVFNYLPESTTHAVYEHTGYTLSYAENFEQAEWVAYELNDSDLKNVNYNRPYFEVDEMVKTGAAHWRNYKKSGYNKGHLCPAGDRKKNFNLYEETFLTSNIAPQTYEFNSGVWNRLEQKVRYWATKYDGLYVVTAGVLTPDLPTIGYENVAVPNYFYKVLLTKDKKRMIGFLIPHKDSNKPLYNFVVPVDTIEKLTGIDFFPELDDALENRLEAASDYKGWSF
ncbi:DNA/RNA non-specific endonuclease [Flavobacterium sp.]|uniref:DNA/RNA non-specific endonuclease n=1 Tax=Flavobacterium sp. TaxID=239 RepID=UPI003529B813